MSKGKLYNLRRKLQTLAYNLTSPEVMSRIYFRLLLKYPLHLKNPQTFNEKLQWLKLYEWPNNPSVIECADKYRVRNYLEKKGMGQYLNELLGVWDNADDIDFDKLPNAFVLKCNHGCGYNIICKDKSELDIPMARKQLSMWLREDFGKFNAEPHYSKIPRRIICEKYLGDNVINYNLYVFNGKVYFFSVAGGLGDGVGEHLTYYMADGKLAPFYNKHYPVKQQELSPLLPRMKEVAQELAKDFDMTRIDLFDINGKIVLSEMTFSPGGALIPFDSYKADLDIGKHLTLNNKSNVCKK